MGEEALGRGGKGKFSMPITGTSPSIFEQGLVKEVAHFYPFQGRTFSFCCRGSRQPFFTIGGAGTWASFLGGRGGRKDAYICKMFKSFHEEILYLNKK